jgi:hypothetical protein
MELNGREWPATQPGCLTPGNKAPVRRFTGGYVGLKVGGKAVEKSLSPAGHRKPIPLCSDPQSIATSTEL